MKKLPQQASESMRWLFMLALVVSTTLGFSQQLEWKQFDKRSGLTDQFVYDLTQDQLGYLWTGTGNGLFRFNGADFVRFGTENGLAENFVTALLADSNDQIWVGHFRGGLSQGSKGYFDTVAVSGKLGPIKALFKYRGHVYGLSQKGGPFRVQGDSLYFLMTEVQHSEQFYDALVMDDSLLVLAGTHGIRMGVVEGGAWEDQTPEGLPKRSFISLSQPAPDRLVLGTHGKGAQFLVRQSGAWMPLETTQVRNSIFAQATTTNNLLWYGTSRGLERQVLDQGYVPVRSELVAKGQGFSNSKVLALLRDNEGRLWAGTNGEGLWVLESDHYTFFDGADFAPESLNLLAKGPGQTLWGASSQTVVQLHVGENGQSLGVVDGSALQIPGTIKAMAFDRSGLLWIGTRESGIWTVESGQRPQRSDFSDSIASSGVLSISVDDRGSIWIATALKGALMISQDYSTSRRYDTSTGLLHNYILQVYHDQQNRHWFLTQGTGLAMLEGEELTYYGEEEGLVNLDFSFLTEDREGRLVLGTAGAGVFRLDSNRFTETAYSHLLKGKLCAGIVYDGTGGVQLISDRSVIRCGAEEGIVFRTQQFDQFSGFRLEGQKNWVRHERGVYLAGGTGLMMIPKAGLDVAGTVDCAVTGFSVSGLDQRLDASPELAYGSYRFRFDFEAVCLNQDLEPQFQYMIEGFDEGWNPLTKEQFADYTGLSDGTYRFLVRSRLEGASIPGPTAALSFTIRTPFWKTWWFLTALVLGFAALVWAFIRIRTYRLQVANQLLEARVAERTETIRQQNKEIRQFTYSVSHDLKSPVNSLVGFVRMLTSDKDSLPADKQQMLGMMDTTAAHLRSSLDRLMELIRNRETANRKREWIDPEEVFEALQANIHELIRESGATLQWSSRIQKLYINRDNLFSILYNLVTNAIKYRKPDEAPVVNIRLIKRGDWIHLSVTDNGLGMDLEKDGERLFEMFKRVHTQGEGSGVGLYLLKELIEGSGGKIEVESKPGEGSTFKVTLPVVDPEPQS